MTPNHRNVQSDKSAVSQVRFLLMDPWRLLTLDDLFNVITDHLRFTDKYLL